MKVTGIHHISTIAWHAQENIDFYAGVLGLKLIKKTLNFDDKNVYHLFFGNSKHIVGSGITFFPWKKDYKEGMVGDGQVGVTTFIIPVGSSSFWKERLKKFNIRFNEVSRFNQNYIRFQDIHGITNELVESDLGEINDFEFNGVNKDVAIKGFFGAVLYSKDFEGTKAFLLDDLGLALVDENQYFVRFEASSNLGKYIDLYKTSMGKSVMGAGAVHHIAFGVAEIEIDSWKETLEKKGYYLTEVKDRKFFKSIYFKEPGGIIIELATLTPGFEENQTDEINPALFIPPHFEHLREEIENEVMPLFVEPVEKLVHYPYQSKQTYLSWKAHQDLLSKINYYAKEAKTRTLTAEEILERDHLRRAYVKSVTGSIKDNLENIMIEDESGNYQDLKKK